LKNSANNGVGKFIFASSSAIYGDTESIPTNEFVTAMPQSPYAEQKLDAEEYCNNYYKSNKLRTTSLRYFNVFGPYQDPGSEYSAVIPKFITLALNNEDLIIYGNGKATRDFVFVDDVIQANLGAAISEKSDGEAINIAHGETISIEDLANMIIEITGSKSSVVHASPRAGDIVHSAADLTKARKLIGYESKTSMERGLSMTIDYFKQSV
jgi:UDP-glucose 4-epimerase